MRDFEDTTPLKYVPVVHRLPYHEQRGYVVARRATFFIIGAALLCLLAYVVG